MLPSAFKTFLQTIQLHERRVKSVIRWICEVLKIVRSAYTVFSDSYWSLSLLCLLSSDLCRKGINPPPFVSSLWSCEIRSERSPWGPEIRCGAKHSFPSLRLCIWVFGRHQ